MAVWSHLRDNAGDGKGPEEGREDEARRRAAPHCSFASSSVRLMALSCGLLACAAIGCLVPFRPPLAGNGLWEVARRAAAQHGEKPKRCHEKTGGHLPIRQASSDERERVARDSLREAIDAIKRHYVAVRGVALSSEWRKRAAAALAWQANEGGGDPATLLSLSLRRLVRDLGDPYTHVLSPAHFSRALHAFDASTIGANVERGGRVAGVARGSPADRARIREGDVILGEAWEEEDEEHVGERGASFRSSADGMSASEIATAANRCREAGEPLYLIVRIPTETGGEKGEEWEEVEAVIDVCGKGEEHEGGEEEEEEEEWEKEMVSREPRDDDTFSNVSSGFASPGFSNSLSEPASPCTPDFPLESTFPSPAGISFAFSPRVLALGSKAGADAEHDSSSSTPRSSPTYNSSASSSPASRPQPPPTSDSPASPPPSLSHLFASGLPPSMLAEGHWASLAVRQKSSKASSGRALQGATGAKKPAASEAWAPPTTLACTEIGPAFLFETQRAVQVLTQSRSDAHSQKSSSRPSAAPMQPAGLVLDLRACRGGSVASAVELAALFLPRGSVVAWESRGPREEGMERGGDANEPGMDGAVDGRKGRGQRTPLVGSPSFSALAPTPDSLPLLVLASPATASAGEIIAGALQRHRRASLWMLEERGPRKERGSEASRTLARLDVGSPARRHRTKGKGVIQRVFELPDGSALVLSSGTYVPGPDPDSEGVDVAGLRPDCIHAGGAHDAACRWAASLAAGGDQVSDEPGAERRKKKGR